MMKLRKVLAIMMAAAMAMSMMACGSKSESADSTADDAAVEDTAEDTAEADDSADDAAVSDETYKVGVCQLLEHVALDAATEGFTDALTDLLGDRVTIDTQSAQGEQAMCSTIINNFISDDVDLILANATLPLQTAVQATADIPIVGTSITDYATALGISDWTGATGVNATGTSDLAPLDEQENMLVELFPEAKTVGILFCSSEANSQYQSDVFMAELEADGITGIEFKFTDSNNIQAVTQSAIEQCDVIYVPTDNTAADNTAVIKNVCVPAGVPVIAGESGICSGCGVATLSISYYDIGYKAGEMAYEILVNGADPATMDIEFAPQVTKMYNAEICEELGITVPEDYEAISAE